MTTPSKTQIDLLGERLKGGSRSETDLILLDSYRRSFSAPYEKVIALLRDTLELSPTGRPAKSTSSIIDKLLRESIRLTQIQDIAGCRVVVNDIPAQYIHHIRITELFTDAREVDRIQEPRYGYRAIHVIPTIDGKPIEIQVRSLLQHLWAELSEKVSDKFGQEIKYGGGPSHVRKTLDELSALIARYEKLQDSSFKKIIDVVGGSKEELAEEVARYSEIRKLTGDIISTLKEAEKNLNQ